MRRLIVTGLRRAGRLTRSYWSDTRGEFGVIFALMGIVLIAFGGAAVDYTLWQNAITSARNAADAGALAGAISSADDIYTIRKVVTGAATTHSMFANLAVKDVTFDDKKDQIAVSVEGTYTTLFVTLVGVHTMPVKAFATSERAQPGELEIALVLDNTWSMSDKDSSGVTKLSALKSASRKLADVLWAEDEAGTVEIGLVPYAQYVNVGVGNRYQSWMTVPADYSSTSTKTCTTKTTKQQCTKGAKATCTRAVDGVSETYDCTPQTCTNVTVDPYESCTGGGTSNYKWYGCVYSRKTGTLRLNDTLPISPYTGYLETSQSCLNPIVPLTKNRDTIKTSLANMIVTINGNKPLTYIPAGMVWGINVLSPTAPFTEANNYDPSKLRPRKALVLMTDGDNTLRFNSSNGQHNGLDANNVTTAANQKAQTDADTLALCTYAKNQGIEVFTVGFGTLLPASDTLLSGCATDTKHYFSANNAAELEAAFQNIGKALRFVRLVQ